MGESVLKKDLAFLSFFEDKSSIYRLFLINIGKGGDYMEVEIIFVLFMLYVVISLWVIHAKLNNITDHVKRQDEEFLTDEQIERELEEDWDKK